MVFQFFQVGHLVARDVGHIVEDEGILFRFGDLDQQFHQTFCAVLGDDGFEVFFQVQVAVEGFGYGLFILFEEGEEHCHEHFFGVGRVVNTQHFSALEVIQQVGFADALGAEEEDIDLFGAEVGQALEFRFAAHVKVRHTLLQGQYRDSLGGYEPAFEFGPEGLILSVS